MTKPQQPKRPSPIFDALDEAIDDSTDDGTETMLSEVVSAIWYGIESAEKIDALIADAAAERDPFDVNQVQATAARELAKKRLVEQAWPPVTDCDRLDRAFARLHQLGICALHCPGDTHEQAIDAVVEVLMDDDTPQDHYHGYCFYLSQDLDHALDNEGLLLAHGHMDRSEAEESQHVAVAEAICEALRQAGLEVEWNGSTNRRIALPRLQWQRRTPG